MTKTKHATWISNIEREERSSLTREELGDIYWHAAHTLDREVPWVRLADDLKAEIWLGGDELNVLGIRDRHADLAWVALARLEREEGERLCVVEIIELHSVQPDRLEVLTRHAEERTERPGEDAILMSGSVRKGARLRLERTPAFTEAHEVLL